VKSGYDQLLRAFAELIQDFSNVRLLIVGGASFTTSISPVRLPFIDATDALIDALSLREHVIRVNSIDYFHLPEVYEKTDIACMLSKMEAFGMSITEAMYYRLPCVVTDVGGLSVQVTDGVNGYKVPVADVKYTAAVLRKLSQDGELRARLGFGARLTFEKFFTPDTVSSSYVHLYDSF
jgi:glycosyltransferase involved in cell wall biosynthesis